MRTQGYSAWTLRTFLAWSRGLLASFVGLVGKHWPLSDLLGNFELRNQRCTLDNCDLVYLCHSAVSEMRILKNTLPASAGHACAHKRASQLTECSVAISKLNNHILCLCCQFPVLKTDALNYRCVRFLSVTFKNLTFFEKLILASFFFF